MEKEGLYYVRLPNNAVRCELCPHRCTMAEGQRGRCKSRHNKGGILVSEVYGQPCALAIDPIEKKPLNEFHPGTRCLSLACTGCNFSCLNCQNHAISQAMPADVPAQTLLPADVVAACLHHGCPTIAYTYTEPLTYYEYVYDTARLARRQQLWNVLVTAGYINPEPLHRLLPLIDAANVDLKAFDDAIYRKISGGRLQPVLDTITAMKQAGVWVEITCLLIPQMTDDMQMIRKMCRWLASNGMHDAPLHFSRFFPAYRLSDSYPTPIATIRQACTIAKEEGISSVYTGNC